MQREHVHRVRPNAPPAPCVPPPALLAFSNSVLFVARTRDFYAPDPEGRCCCGKTRLHVPPKEAVFKHAGHKDLGACILAWLEQKYGADLAARKRDVLAQLQAARMEAVKAAGQGGKSLTTREALRSLLSWYHVLAELDLPFGLDESKGLLRVRFEYCQALATAKMTKSYTPQLERAATLFNAAAVLSAQASEQSDARRAGAGGGEPWKVQCHTFRAAAGLFHHIRDEFFPAELAAADSALTEDLSAAGLDCFAALMLAQAQECFFEQASEQGMSLAIRAKVCAGTAKCYADASKAAGHRQLVDAQRIVRTYCAFVQRYFAMQAELLTATQLLAEHEKSGSGIGRAIQYLRAVAAQQPEARAALSAWTKLVTEAKADWHLQRMTAQETEVGKLLAEAEKDNSEIYYEPVSDGAAPPVEAKVFVTPLDPEESEDYTACNPHEEEGVEPALRELARGVARLSRPLELEAEWSAATMLRSGLGFFVLVVLLFLLGCRHSVTSINR